MKTAVYARISTQGGRQDLSNQLNPLREWADRLGGSIVQEYVDEASGSKSDRIALGQLLEDAHRRKFDTLLIWALDRLSREGIARMSGYLEKLKACGVRVLSHQEPWLDTSGPVADLLIAIFGWVAQQERLRIRERVMAGLKTARAKGKSLGRPKRVVDVDRANILSNQGLGVREIAQHLGIPKSTIARILSQKPLTIAA